MEYITIKSKNREEFIDITNYIADYIKDKEYNTGILYLYVPHTTAAITINENADPSVIRDINNTLSKLIPFNNNYTHLEGNSDAHIKATLVGTSTFVIVENRELVLGTWQGIFFCEFDGPRNRKVFIKFISNTQY
jgi:secondary thiamine-phosphate synthase enzyme